MYALAAEGAPWLGITALVNIIINIKIENIRACYASRINTFIFIFYEFFADNTSILLLK